MKRQLVPLFSKVKHYFNRLGNRYPAIIVFVGLLNGVFPFFINDNSVFSWSAWFVVVFSMVAIAFFFLSKFRAVVFVSFTMAGIGLSSIQIQSLKKNTEGLSRPNCGAIIEAVVVDPSCAGKAVEWLPNPNMIKCRLIRMKYTEQDRWRHFDSRFFLKSSSKAPLLRYADGFTAKGAFIAPSKALFRGDFDFSSYMIAKGRNLLFEAETITTTPLTKVPFSRKAMMRLLSFRDKLIISLTKDIRSLETKATLAALFFGCRQGVAWREKQNFIKSGTIHFFAISGLHIGMLSVLIVWGLCWVPFRVRYYLAPIMLFFYVASIGFQASAVRAFLMISIWCVFRANLIRLSPLNIVFLSAAVITLINPFSPMDIGFQYSFVVSAFLVVSWRTSNQWLTLWNEKRLWIPSRATSRLDYVILFFRTNAMAALFTAFIACMAATGITFFYRGLFTPVAIATNVILIPFIWGVFILGTAQIIIGGLVPIGGALAVPLQFLMTMVEAIVRFASEHGFTSFICVPPLWSLVVFYVGLAILVSSTRSKGFVIGVAIVIGSIVIWTNQNLFTNGKITVFHGGDSSELSVLIFPPERKDVFLLNVPSPKMAAKIAAFMNVNGREEINTLIIRRPVKSCVAGGFSLLERIPVKSLIIPSVYRRSEYAARVVDKAREKNIDVRFIKALEGKWDWNSTTNQAAEGNQLFQWRIKLPDYRIGIQLESDESGKTIIKFGAINEHKPETIQKWILERASNLNIRSSELKDRK